MQGAMSRQATGAIYFRHAFGAAPCCGLRAASQARASAKWVSARSSRLPWASTTGSTRWICTHRATRNSEHGR